MRRIVRSLLLASLAIAAYSSIAAQTPGPPPKVMWIVREEIKTGKMPAHTVEANNTVQIWSKARSQHHRLAMVPIAGNENEVMYIWPCDSFAEIEKTVNDLDRIAGVTHKADFDRISAMNNGEDLHTSQRDAIAVLRPELSYNPNVDITKMRFVRTEVIRVKPGMGRDWEEGRKILKAAHEKAKIDEHMLVYQVVGGMQSGTYLVFIPWKSLDGLGTLPHGKEYWDGMGDDNRRKLDKINEDSVVFNDLIIYGFNPQLSYVPAEFVASDTFWTFKPMQPPMRTVAGRTPRR